VKIYLIFFCPCVLHCMFLCHDHLQLPQTCNCSPRNPCFKFFLFLQHFCNIYFLVSNIRYRPNILQHILAKYSFSAETENFVFGRSLVWTKYKVIVHRNRLFSTTSCRHLLTVCVQLYILWRRCLAVQQNYYLVIYRTFGSWMLTSHSNLNLSRINKYTSSIE
jgi:hypothetical protein